MDFNTAVKTCFAKYATFTGRAPRSEFWWFILLGFILALIAMVVDTLVLGHTIRDPLRPAGLILTIGLFMPNWAVAVRRFHDLDKSGWWTAPYLAIQVITLAFQFAGSDFNKLIGEQSLAVSVPYFVLVIGMSITYLVWFCGRGTVGPNRYGEDVLPPEQPAPIAIPPVG